jgi:hypothetical protein
VDIISLDIISNKKVSRVNKLFQTQHIKTDG